MKDPVSIQILQDIQTAWNTLNPQLIIKHLDKPVGGIKIAHI